MQCNDHEYYCVATISVECERYQRTMQRNADWFNKPICRFFPLSHPARGDLGFLPTPPGPTGRKIITALGFSSEEDNLTSTFTFPSLQQSRYSTVSGLYCTPVDKNTLSSYQSSQWKHHAIMRDKDLTLRERVALAVLNRGSLSQNAAITVERKHRAP